MADNSDSSGCGCLTFIILVFLVGLGIVSFEFILGLFVLAIISWCIGKMFG